MTLIDSEVAALILGVSARRVQQLVALNLLTNHGTERKIRLRLDEVEAFRLTCG